MWEQHAAFPALPVNIHTIHAADDMGIEQMAILRFLRPVDPHTRRLLRPLWIVYSFMRARLKTILLRLFTVRIRSKEFVEFIYENECDAIMACTGDLYDLPAAYEASVKCGIPFFAYIMDDYRYHYGRRNRLFSEYYEPKFMKGATGALVLNSYVQRAYHARYQINCTVLHIPAELPNLDELDMQGHVLNQSKINIVYTGAVYHAHYDAFRNLIQALDILDRDDIKLHIFSSQTPESLAEQGITGKHIIFHEHMPHGQVARVLRDADILFLPLAFHSDIDEVLVNTSPSKMGEYLAVGRTILVHTRKDYFLSDYFSRHDCGLVVDELNPQFLADEITSILEDQVRRERYANNARLQAEIDFDANKLQTQFQQFLSSHMHNT